MRRETWRDMKTRETETIVNFYVRGFGVLTLTVLSFPTALASRFLRNRAIFETFYILSLIAELSPILLLYLCRVSPSVNKRNQT